MRRTAGSKFGELVAQTRERRGVRGFMFERVVLFNALSTAGAGVTLDWWPHEWLKDPERHADGRRHDVGWGERGFATTVERIWAAVHGRHERATADDVWAAAVLHWVARHDNLPIAWRGDSYRLVRSVQETMSRELDPFDDWHHAAKSIPVVAWSWEATAPTTAGDLAERAVDALVELHTEFMLVEIIYDKRFG